MSGELRDLIEIEQVGSRVTALLADFLAWQLSTAVPGSQARALVQPAADLVLADGKRLRAALCYWGWRAGGGPDVDAAVEAAAAVEVLHAVALIHDDVMDHSATRRGRPAVHVRFGNDHARNAWRGSATDFGASAAILAGDLCLVWADMILNASGLDPSARRRGAVVYDEMRRSTICGQFMDLVGQARGQADPDLARAIARGKTVSSTTAGPMLFGAELAGATPAVVAALQAYAAPLGLAFQLQDDLLDTFGEPEVTGKPAGQDLRDGKPTLLLALARRDSDRAAVTRIDRLLGIGDDEAVAELRHLIEATGARQLVEREIAALVGQATRAVDAGPLPRDVGDVLRRIARAAVTVHDRVR